MNDMKISIVCLLFLSSVYSLASVPKKATKAPPPIPTQWLVQDGVVRGGSADSYMSLLDVRRTYSKKAKTERLVFDWGGKSLGPVTKGGYYQVEYHKAAGKIPAHVIVSLSLTLNSKVESHMLNQKTKDGLFIKQARLDFDPVSQAQNLTFDLKRPVRVRVMSFSGQKNNPRSPAHLVVDLVE
jgi:hypothetical protein